MSNNHSDKTIEQDKITNQDKEAPKMPPKYQVVLLNNDYTPIEFVIFILMKVFNKTEDEATSIAWKVHEEDKATVGIYTREIAETKIETVHHYSQENGFPLRLELHKI